MSEAGPFTELQRSEGKRKAVESEANRLAHEAAKLSGELDEAKDYSEKALRLAEERLAKGARLEEELDEARDALREIAELPGSALRTIATDPRRLARIALNGSAPSRLETKAYGGSM